MRQGACPGGPEESLFWSVFMGSEVNACRQSAPGPLNPARRAQSSPGKAEKSNVDTEEVSRPQKAQEAVSVTGNKKDQNQAASVFWDGC